jgi:hypothetical protein
MSRTKPWPRMAYDRKPFENTFWQSERQLGPGRLRAGATVYVCCQNPRSVSRSTPCVLDLPLDIPIFKEVSKFGRDVLRLDEYLAIWASLEIVQPLPLAST